LAAHMLSEHKRDNDLMKPLLDRLRKENIVWIFKNIKVVTDLRFYK